MFMFINVHLTKAMVFSAFREKVGSHNLKNMRQFAWFGTICTKKKREKNPWGSVTFSKACNFTKSNNPPWVFFRFLNCKNGTKLCKTLHIYPANHKIDKDMSPAYFQERIILEIVLWRYANVTVTTGNTNMFKHSPQKVHKNLPPLQTHLAKRPTKFIILMLCSCCRYWM